MTDVVSPSKRSEMMSAIKNKDTKPEVLVRKALHRKGFRFRIHDNKLPGKPDIVLPKFKTVILVNGCFWHGHDCHLFKWPKSNKAFWEEKINATKARDIKQTKSLEKAGWQVIIIWECSMKGRSIDYINQIIDTVASKMINQTSS